LSAPSNTQKTLSLVCFPYGGGSATVYRELALNLPIEIELWGVTLPGHDLSDNQHNLKSFDKNVEGCLREIQNRINGPIALYGHCAGNALLIEVGRRLEHAGTNLKGVHLGAMIPDDDPELVLKTINNETESGLINFLRSIGGFSGNISEPDIRAIAVIAKHDAMLAAEFFYRNLNSWQQLEARAHVILGEDDIVTKDYKSKINNWLKFMKNVSLEIIPKAGHYFINDHATDVAVSIAKFHGIQFNNKEQKLAHESLVVPHNNSLEISDDNPFDEMDGDFLVLRNSNNQLSLWPTFAIVPDGWDIVFGPDTRQNSLDFVST